MKRRGLDCVQPILLGQAPGSQQFVTGLFLAPL
jgi:hypothetical protein